MHVLQYFFSFAPFLWVCFEGLVLIFIVTSMHFIFIHCCVFSSELLAHQTRHLACPQGDQGNLRAQHPYQRHTFPLHWCRWSEVTETEVVPVFCGHNLDSLPGCIIRVWPSPNGGQEDQPATGVLWHLWDNHQQQIIQQRFHYPLPEQDGFTGGEDQACKHRGLFWWVSGWP